jgi:hypothetical protein
VARSQAAQREQQKAASARLCLLSLLQLMPQAKPTRQEANIKQNLFLKADAILETRFFSRRSAPDPAPNTSFKICFPTATPISACHSPGIVSLCARTAHIACSEKRARTGKESQFIIFHFYSSSPTRRDTRLNLNSPTRHALSSHTPKPKKETKETEEVLARAVPYMPAFAVTCPFATYVV